jgi:hypothetical protein
MTPADTLLPILAGTRKVVGRRGIGVSKAVGACFYIL